MFCVSQIFWRLAPFTTIMNKSDSLERNTCHQTTPIDVVDILMMK